MNARAIHLFAGLPVSDLVRATAWYERLLGRPPDRRPMPDEVVWQIAETGSIYVVIDAARAGSGLVTVIVEDLGRMLAEAGGRGLVPDTTQGARGELRRAVFTDPDENRLTFGQLP